MVAISRIFRSGLASAFAAIGALLSLTTSAYAVPSYAAQTGQPCSSCHVGGFGPQLTPFGREFKLGAYSMRAGKATVPLSVMAIASYLRTHEPQSGLPGNFHSNDNVALDEVGLFLAGGGKHVGGFIQGTYDGVEKGWAWDNVDLRTAWPTTIAGANAVIGASLNNSPTTQDVWNSLAAWGYPYTDSGLAPGPSTALFINDAWGQNVLGMTAYTWINSQFYLEGGGYRSLGANAINKLGGDAADTSKINGVAPYFRVAYQKNFGQQNFEIGAFGLFSHVFPGRDQSVGATDRVSDIGADMSWQYFAANKDVFSANARYTHERQSLDASTILALASNSRNTLDEFRFEGSYYWRNKVGATIGYFNLSGNADPMLYAFSRTFSPDSSGVTFQIDGTLFGDHAGPLGQRFNIRVGVQYAKYFKVDGSKNDFDGAGTNASADNTLRIFMWGAY